MRELLLDQLRGYRPPDPNEAAMTRRMRRFVERHANCCSRALLEGHITGSAWVVDFDRSHALLTHHHRLDRWLQPGGHVEDDASVLDAALREVREESGLAAVRPVLPGLWDLDIHPIPARGAEPGHLHYDLRFLVEADRALPLTVSSESRELAWVPITEVSRLNPEESIMRLVRKSLAGLPR